jgi:hypothetical protein
MTLLDTSLSSPLPLLLEAKSVPSELSLIAVVVIGPSVEVVS